MHHSVQAWMAIFVTFLALFMVMVALTFYVGKVSRTGKKARAVPPPCQLEISCGRRRRRRARSVLTSLEPDPAGRLLAPVKATFREKEPP